MTNLVKEFKSQLKEKIYPLWIGHMGDVYRVLTEREKNISEFYEKDLHLNFIKK